MALVTEAVLENPRLNAAKLARKMGLNRFTVARVVQSIRQAGGWYTKIVWKTCVCCGEPMATSGAANGPGPAKYHERCKYRWGWQKEKEKTIQECKTLYSS